MGCKLDAVNPDGTHRNRRDRLVGAIASELFGPPDQANPNTNGKNQELWLTPRANEPDEPPGNVAKRLKDRGEHCHGSLTAQAKSQESWATPRADKYTAENLESWEKRHKEGKVSQQPLPTQVQNWPTPTAMSRPRSEETMEKCLKFRQSKGKNTVPLYLEEKVKKVANGKLNPNWVEQLMGLPVGWTQLPTAWIG